MSNDTENPTLDATANGTPSTVEGSAAPKRARAPRPQPQPAPAPKAAAPRKPRAPRALAGSDGNGNAPSTTDIPVTMEDMAAAELLVETLGGMAEAALVEPAASDWYVLVQQMEMVEQSVGGKKKAKNLAPKLARQIGKSVDLLQALFAQSSSTPSLLSDNQRAITRFLALLEVDLPDKKSAQRVYADILKNERRALAKTLGATPEDDPLD